MSLLPRILSTGWFLRLYGPKHQFSHRSLHSSSPVYPAFGLKERIIISERVTKERVNGPFLVPHLISLSPRLVSVTPGFCYHLVSHRLPLRSPFALSLRRAAAAGEERAEVRREARRTEGRDETKAAGCDRGS